MKLEMDLLRDLLLYVEEHANRPVSEIEDISLDGWQPDEVAYHVILAEEDGLIKAVIEMLPDDTDLALTHVVYTVQRLTSRGHELLGAIREPRHWKVIKDGSKKAGLATIGAIVSFAEAYVKAKANQYLGVTSE